MANRISGPGVGLPIPQQLYPANLSNGETTTSTNEVSLAPGQALPIAAGEWLVALGKYLSLQFLDPVTGMWRDLRSGVSANTPAYVRSDGFNLRISNMTGCVVGATVTNGGNGSYVQATTTVTPSAGNSTWQPIVGGAINSTITITAPGSNFGIPPLVFIDSPPNPGIQATAIAVLTNNSVSSITVLRQGAGYPVAPNVTILPNPADPNLSSGITNATATCSLTGTGSITAVLLLNPGASVATSMSLTVAGGGASAAVTPFFLESITAASITSGGGGYAAGTELSSTNGGYNGSAPAFLGGSPAGFVPRKAQIQLGLTGTSITSISTIVDGGLFIETPNALAVTNGVVTTAANIALTLGGQNDTAIIQQL